jgi:hypothetical protein
MTDVLLAFTNAQGGREQAFDRWYTDEHVPRVLEVEGVVGARRLEAVDGLEDGPQHPYRFLAVYDIAAGESAATAERLVTVGPPMSEDVEGVPAAWCYEEVAPHVAADGAGDGPFDLMVVLTNPTPGGEAAFNRWYDEIHIPDVLNTIGGYVGARRFRRIDGLPFNRDNPWAYMALYDMPKGAMAYCHDRIKWSHAEHDDALAAGRTPAVVIAPEMSDERLAWFYRETLSRVPAPA